MVYIYILRLESNKYYIGKTLNPKFRLETHFSSNGSSWTRKYKPINIHQLIPDCDNFDEDKYTLKYMEKYGIDNVRGGSFCQLKLTEQNKNTIKHMISGASDKCYKCGKLGHFASSCNNIFPENLEQVFSEMDKDEGIYTLDGTTYLWYDGELYEESNNKTPKRLLKILKLNCLYYYMDYNWKSIYISKKKYKDSNSEEEYDFWTCDYCNKKFDSKKGATFHENVHCKKRKQMKNEALYSASDNDSDNDSDNEWYEESYNQPIKKKKKSTRKSSCYKCGRKGHYASKCYAKKHINGFYLK